MLRRAVTWLDGMFIPLRWLPCRSLYAGSVTDSHGSCKFSYLLSGFLESRRQHSEPPKPPASVHQERHTVSSLPLPAAATNDLYPLKEPLQEPFKGNTQKKPLNLTLKRNPSYSHASEARRLGWGLPRRSSGAVDLG